MAQNGGDHSIDINDMVLWTGFQGKIAISEHGSYVISTQLWSNEDMGTYQSLFLEQGLEYKIIGNYSIGIRHRYQRFPTSSQNRFFIDHLYHSRLENKLIWSNRLRVHINTLKTRGPQYWFRLKTGLSLKTQGGTPYLDIELFTQPLEPDSSWDRVRIYSGSKWPLTDNISLKTYYVLQRFWKKDPDLNEHIWGVEITLSIR